LGVALNISARLSTGKYGTREAGNRKGMKERRQKENQNMSP
jgi:hypothetical protein